MTRVFGSFRIRVTGQPTRVPVHLLRPVGGQTIHTQGPPSISCAAASPPDSRESDWLPGLKVFTILHKCFLASRITGAYGARTRNLCRDRAAL